MATATAPAKPTQQQTKPQEAKSLLEQILDMPLNERVKQLDKLLTARVEKVESLLPDFLKGQGERLVRRAMLTFSSKRELQECTPDSFVKCVLQAAELGFAIDGRLAYAVPYSNKKTDEKGKEYWVMESQLQVDYKGLIAAAKRNKLIQDVWARLIWEDDEFELYEEDSKTHYRHTPNLRPRKGDPLGVLSVATHADGWYRVDWMNIEEINAVKNRSKASKGFSPWKTDENEMRKKTGIRRLLKTFTDDPGLARLFEIDDQNFEREEEQQQAPQKPAGRSQLDQLADQLGGMLQISGLQNQTTPVQDSQTEQTEHVPDPVPSNGGRREPGPSHVVGNPREQAWNQYLGQMQATKTDFEADEVYNRIFGEGSAVDWSPEEDTAAAQARDRHKENLKKPKGAKGKSQLFESQQSAQEAGM